MHPDPRQDLLGQVHVAVIRLDGKVDDLKDQFAEFKDLYRDHELRIRAVEAGHPLLERVIALENRPYVSPATVWRVVGFLMSVLALAATVVIAIVK